MRQKSLESLVRTANTAGAAVICEYDWPKSWPSCWDWHSLTCFLNMKDPQPELRWGLQHLIFEAQTHMGGVQNAFLMHFWNNRVIIYLKERYLPWCKKATQLRPQLSGYYFALHTVRRYFRRRSQSAKSAVIKEPRRLKTAERKMLVTVPPPLRRSCTDGSIILTKNRLTVSKSDTEYTKINQNLVYPCLKHIGIRVSCNSISGECL